MHPEHTKRDEPRMGFQPGMKYTARGSLEDDRDGVGTSRRGYDVIKAIRLESLPGFVSRSALTPGGTSQARLTRGY